MKNNIIKDKSYSFALKVVATYKDLQASQNEYIMSKQLLRSGTSIGALIRESEMAESKKDFIHKMSIALKEANETNYWLDLLKDSGYDLKSNRIKEDCVEVLKILVKIVKSSKQTIDRN